MDIHDTTRYKFAKSIKELMHKQSLDKITVTDIVSNTTLTRQTFYRYFKDKYDLVNWYFRKMAEQSIAQMNEGASLKEGLMKKFQFIQEEKVFFTQAFKSNDYNSLVQYDFEYIYEFYKQMIEQKQSQKCDQQMDFLLQMYCRGSVDMTVEWVETGMKMSIDEITDLLIQALPPMLSVIFLS